MVPEGMKTAASFPKRSATRSHNRLTLGSSPLCSSPTSARAMASRIAGVGRVWVSDSRLTRTGGALGSRGGGVYVIGFPSDLRPQPKPRGYLNLAALSPVCISTHEFQGRH